MGDFFNTLSSDDFIFASYFSLIISAGIAAAVYLRHLVRQLRLHGLSIFWTRAFLTALFIFGIALCTFMIRTWFHIWKGGDYVGIDTTWMLSHWFVGVIVIIFSLIYTGHTATITHDSHRHYLWIGSLILTICGFFAGLYFTQNHQWALDLILWAKQLDLSQYFFWLDAAEPT